MSAKTRIEWTRGDDGTAGKTWNPVTGCTKVSPGCAHCYAEGVAERFWAKQYPMVQDFSQPAGPGSIAVIERPRKFTDVQCHEDRLLEPLSWRKPARVFVNSMSDLFHEDVPDTFIDKVFAVMALAPQHTFQVLTKRPERMRAYLAADGRHSYWNDAADRLEASDSQRAVIRERAIAEGVGAVRDETMLYRECDSATDSGTTPLQNVWLGTSVENQPMADKRIPELLQTPAAVRFISAEPLLGPVNLHASMFRCCRSEKCDESVFGLDWVIVGGESGPQARPFDLAWARSIVRQCQAAGVPVFVKQIGDNPQEHGNVSRFKQRTRKGGAIEDFPADLRVREFPEVRA